MLQRPNAEEHAPFFAAYIGQVPEGDLIQILENQQERVHALFAGLSEEKAMSRYAPGKWSLKEVLGHITDTERVMSYRLLRVARGDQTALPGFDENVFVDGAAFDRRSMTELLEEFDTVRSATLKLIRGIQQEAWARVGTVSNHSTSARALAFVIAGHERHHGHVVRERYLK
ncbi:DinB family protein [Paenibacillus koleovorans]|uniref:DinB family protein n=1 Tax=Paenibacillus koleovorans TaxID=121608 RepID=UPI000FDCCEE0|nr:DinB family protein [Paenibacillus koleovorans]